MSTEKDTVVTKAPSEKLSHFAAEHPPPVITAVTQVNRGNLTDTDIVEVNLPQSSDEIQIKSYSSSSSPDSNNNNSNNTLPGGCLFASPRVPSPMGVNMEYINQQKLQIQNFLPGNNKNNNNNNIKAAMSANLIQHTTIDFNYQLPQKNPIPYHQQQQHHHHHHHQQHQQMTQHQQQLSQQNIQQLPFHSNDQYLFNDLAWRARLHEEACRQQLRAEHEVYLRHHKHNELTKEHQRHIRQLKLLEKTQQKLSNKNTKVPSQPPVHAPRQQRPSPNVTMNFERQNMIFAMQLYKQQILEHQAQLLSIQNQQRSLIIEKTRQAEFHQNNTNDSSSSNFTEVTKQQQQNQQQQQQQQQSCRYSAVAHDFDNTLYRLRQKADTLNDPHNSLNQSQQPQRRNFINSSQRYAPYLRRSPTPADSTYDARWNQQRLVGFHQATNIKQQQFYSPSLPNSGSPPILHPAVKNNLRPTLHNSSNNNGLYANSNIPYQNLAGREEGDHLFLIRQQSQLLEQEKTKRLMRLDLALRHQESLSGELSAQKIPPPLVLPTNDNLSMVNTSTNLTLSPDSGLGSIGDVSDHVFDENNIIADLSPSSIELNFKFTKQPMDMSMSTATTSSEAALCPSSETVTTTPTTDVAAAAEKKKKSLLKPRRWLNTKMSSWKSRMASEENKDRNIVSPTARKSFDFGDDSISTVSSPGSLVIDEDIDV